jgi:hypothetical protein
VNVQSKVMKWAIQFQADPTSAGINYENINGARDPNLKSVRMDKDWRGIVFKPSSGRCVCPALREPPRRGLSLGGKPQAGINPVTGAMQLVMLESVTVEQVPVPAANDAALSPAAPVAVAAPAPAECAFCSAVSDHELMSLGVPEELLPEVRRHRNGRTTGRDAGAVACRGLRRPVPGGCGRYRQPGAWYARETRVDRAVDTPTLLSALATPESQSRFVIVTTTRPCWPS